MGDMMTFDGTVGLGDLVAVAAVLLGVFWFVRKGIADAVPRRECGETHKGIDEKLAGLHEKVSIGLLIVNGNLKRVADKLPHNPNPVVLKDLPWLEKQEDP